MNSRFSAALNRRRRMRLLWLIAALWTACVVGVAGWLAHERVREHHEQSWSNAAVRLAGIRDTLGLTFRQLAAVPRNLARQPSVVEFLSTSRLPDTAALPDAERERLLEGLLRDPAVQTMNTQ